MRKFILKIALIVIPVLLWGVIIVVVDPFSYFNHNLVGKDAKKPAESLNTLMYRTLDYMNAPSENMLIGDSRTNALPIDLVSQLTDKSWKKLNTNAAKLNEIFDLFYMANERKKLKNVIIGINFNMFNEYGFMDRVSGLKKMQDNPLMYIYNKDVAEAAYYTMKGFFLNEEFESKPSKSKEEFWKWNVSVKATHWYGRYKFPDTLCSELIAFDEYTQKNDINVVFIITPHHKDFHDRLVHFGLENEEKRFKEIMFNLNAKVYDYDFKNEITQSKSNFLDPVHYTDSIGELMINEIVNDELKIGRTQ
jgi:hypothetical protein